MRAIQTELMVNFDGTMMPLTFRQRLLHSDRQSLLEKKIALVRMRSKAICDSVEEIEVGDEGMKDIALMRK